MNVTAADIAKLTPRQRDVLGNIAIGFDSGHPTTTLRILIEKGFVEAREDKVYGYGPRPIDRIPINVTRYDCPLPVHMAWAEWCDKQVDNP